MRNQRKEKRPSGSMPPAFSCSCRFPEPGSAAIPCLIIRPICLI